MVSLGVTVNGKFLSILDTRIDQTTIVGGSYTPSTAQPTHRVFTIVSNPGRLTRLSGLNSLVCRLVSASPHVMAGLDFFNGQPKPGYRPFAYPHPPDR